MKSFLQACRVATLHKRNENGADGVCRNITILAVMLIGISLSLGCARTVTDKSSLLQIDIEIALRAPLSSDDYVAIVFNTTTPPTTPSASVQSYFPLPGQTIKEEDPPISVETYYEEYFNTWSDYILCQVGGPSFYASGSSGFPATTTDNTSIAPKTTFTVVQNFQSSTATLKLSFFVGEIANTTAGSTLYINILTTQRNPIESGNSGYFKDVLRSPIAIQLRSGQEVSRSPEQESDIGNISIPAASDIQACRVSIF